jgi:hypothetical protein
MTAFVLAGAAIGITSILAFAALRGWRGWLDYKRLELAQRALPEAPGDDTGVRIELAAVLERLKKLEAIAAGVEL